MARKRKKGKRGGQRSGAATTDIIKGLFAKPPQSNEALEARLARVDKRQARLLLLDLLRSDKIDDDSRELFGLIFGLIGLDSALEPLKAIAVDERLPQPRRFGAWSALLQEAGAFESIQETLSPRDLTLFTAKTMTGLFDILEEEPEANAQITQLLLESDPSDRLEFFGMIDAIRREVETPPALVYGDALMCDALGTVHLAIIEVLGEEGGHEAIVLLEAFRARSPEAPPVKASEQALAQIRRRQLKVIEPEVDLDSRRRWAAQRGFARVGTCDGQGAFPIWGCFHRDGSELRVAALTVRIAGELREGFILSRMKRSELDEMAWEIREGSETEMVEVSLIEAAQLVSEAMQRTEAMGITLDQESLRAASMILKYHQPGLDLQPPIEPAESVTLDEARELMEGPIHTYWFVDQGDLSAVGANAQPDLTEEADDAQTLDALAGGPLPARLSAMARHHAWWHHHKGLDHEAGLFAALAGAIDVDPRHSPLLSAVYENKAPTTPDLSKMQRFLPGDPLQRETIRRMAFQGLKRARGHHLAELDFTDLLVGRLRETTDQLPGEHRMPDKDAPRHANRLARIFLRLITKDDSEAVYDFIREGARALASYGAREEDCEDLARENLAAATFFASKICTTCPVNCLADLEGDHTEAFFDETHPIHRNPHV